MTREQLLEVIKAVGFEQSMILNYINNMTVKLNEMKENAIAEDMENELYKTNSNTGTNQYFRLSFKLGETKILLNRYQEEFKKLTESYNSENYNIDLSNNIIISSSCKHYINQFGAFDNSDYKAEEIISSVDYQVSPYTTVFGNSVKLFEFHCLDQFIDLKEYEIDVQGIYQELENNEDNYNENDIQEIKNATVQLANLFARRKNSMTMEIKDSLNEFDFESNQIESGHKHI